ncbi:MAG: hypothetical protein K9K82_13045 [Desulfobacteraceae bacterium]|nr:hypothetical protein [Desulfobacteraceae bacterium]
MSALVSGKRLYRNERMDLQYASEVAMIIFGFRELPRPKGWGDFYFRFPPSRREIFIGNLDLYQASGEDLKVLFERGIKQAEEEASESEQIQRLLANGEYQTENIADWAAEILKEVIEQYRQKESGYVFEE